MSEDFKKFNQEMMQKNASSDNDFVFPDDLPTHPSNEPIPESGSDKDPLTGEPWADSSQPLTDEPKTEEAPTLKTNGKGTYHGFFLAPVNHLQRITDALTKMAETDQELAIAIAVGKKTFEGCDRYIRNNMADLAREMGQREITFDDDTVHQIARYYMVNPDNLDVQNVAKAVKETKKESKPKAEKKPKAEPKKKETKVIPLTPAMGSLFGDDDFK